MNRYDFYNNLELFHKTKEIIQQEEQEKTQNDLNELKHYGTKGQKWGVRKWQNYDGTFNEAGKERYFGKSSQTTSTEEDKVGSARSDVKEYLKFRNKMLKKRTHGDLNKWYRDNNKAADKQLLKDAKRVDKQREKMYKNQLKDFYDDPNELVSDLDRIYKIGGEADKQKIGSTNYTWDRMDNVYKYDDKYQNADGTLTKKGQKLLDKGKNTEGLINMDLYDKSKYTDEDWDNEIKKSEEHQKKLVDDAKAKVKTTKELSGDTINDQEFKDIIEEVNNFDMRDFYKNHREEYNDVADIGMDALNKSDEYGSKSKIGDDGDREWFMFEDQTIGNPEIAYLYYKGYSKDYIKQYLNKPLTEELIKMQDEDPYAGGFFVRDEFHRGGDAYIDALFDKGEDDQKIGSSPDSKKIFENKTDADYMDKDGNFDDKKYWKDKEKAEKYLYDNYDKEFARTMIEDIYDTTGEWGDIDKQYEEYKKDPYHFTHLNINPKAEKKATKLANKINDELEETFKFDRKHEDEVMDSYILDDKEYAPLFENLRKSNNETLAKDYDEVEEIFKDYKGNDRGTTSRAIAGITNFLEDDNQTMKDLAFETWFHAYEDGDQGYANGPSLYARYEKNIKPEEIDRLYTNLHANNNLINDNIMYLKNNNQVLSKVNDEYLKRLVERNEDQWNDRRKTSAYWELYDAADGSRYDDNTLKKNYQEAKQIAKKLEKSTPNGGWYYLNQAIDNLNMGDMNYKDLSQADWDKINAEINKLKK